MYLIFLIPKLLRSFSVFIFLSPLHWGDTLSLFCSWGSYSQGDLSAGIHGSHRVERNSTWLQNPPATLGEYSGKELCGECRQYLC